MREFRLESKRVGQMAGKLAANLGVATVGQSADELEHARAGQLAVGTAVKWVVPLVLSLVDQ